MSFECKGASGAGIKDIIFRPFNDTADTEAMRIKGSGDVCIGTTATMSTTNLLALVVGDGAGTEGITIYSGNDSSGWLAFADGTTGDQSYRGIVQYSHANDAMSFHTQGTTERMRINSTGLGIGTTSPSANLDVYNGSGWSELHLDGSSGGEIKLQKAGTTYLDIYSNDAGSSGSVIYI